MQAHDSGGRGGRRAWAPRLLVATVLALPRPRRRQRPVTWGRRALARGHGNAHGRQAGRERAVVQRRLLVGQPVGHPHLGLPHLPVRPPRRRTWVDTGVTTETRANTHHDVLWDGTTLYIASHLFVADGVPAAAGFPSTLRRYSYNASTDTYTLLGSSTQINNQKTESLVIDKDTTGPALGHLAAGQPDLRQRHRHGRRDLGNALPAARRGRVGGRHLLPDRVRARDGSG